MQKSVRSEVEKVLRKYKGARDNDNILLAKVWARQSGGAFDITFKEIADGLYWSPETIRRARQMLQYDYPELRGNKYQERQKMAEHTRLTVAR